MIMIAILAIPLLASVAFLPHPVFALSGSSGCGSGTGKIENPDEAHLLPYCTFKDLLTKIVQIFLEVAGAVAVIFLMIGGFQYLSSRGNEDAMEKAKKTITSSVIGIVLIVMAFAIVSIINNILTPSP